MDFPGLSGISLFCSTPQISRLPGARRDRNIGYTLISLQRAQARVVLRRYLGEAPSSNDRMPCISKVETQATW